MQYIRTLRAVSAALFILAALFCAQAAQAAQAAQNAQTAQAAPLRSAWLDEFEAFAAWYAHEQKWDQENGLAVEIRHVPTGRMMVDNMRAYDWNLAACGGVPALRAMLRKDVYVVGVGADEASANAVYTRPDSPLARATSADEAARFLRGKTVLCPLGTSAHQLLLAWLNGLGLEDTDVIIVDVKPAEAASALAKGMGEAAALWAPVTYEAEELGLHKLTDGQKSGIAQPVLLLAERGYADKNPEQVKAFLRGYLRAVDAFRAMPAEKLAQLYQRFQKEFAGREISLANARREVQTHPLFSLQEQKALLGAAPGAQGALRDWLRDVTAFHKKTGALSHGEARELQALPLVTPRFLP